MHWEGSGVGLDYMFVASLLNKLCVFQDVCVSIFANRWHPRKLQQNSRIVIDNVSAQFGHGAGFLVKGDANISVRNSDNSNQTRTGSQCERVVLAYQVK